MRRKDGYSSDIVVGYRSRAGAVRWYFGFCRLQTSPDLSTEFLNNAQRGLIRGDISFAMEAKYSFIVIRHRRRTIRNVRYPRFAVFAHYTR